MKLYKIPTWIFDLKHINIYEKIILINYYRIKGLKNLNLTISVEEFSKAVVISRRAFQQYCRTLQKKKILIVEYNKTHDGEYLPSTYHVNEALFSHEE